MQAAASRTIPDLGTAHDRWPLHRLAGIVVLVLGAVVGSHWTLQTELVARWLPGVARIGIVNPALFSIAGLLLLDTRLPLAPHARPRWRRLGAGIGIALLLLLPAGHLFEALTGVALGIDFTLNDATPTVQNPYPGRLSPNACLAFLASGLAFWLLQRPMTAPRRRLLLLVAAAVGLIGYAGLAGHFAGLERLYQLADFNRILPATAFGFVVIGIGLWSLHDAALPQGIELARRRIARRTLVVCTLVAISAGIAGFSVMRDIFEQTLSRNMLATDEDALYAALRTRFADLLVALAAIIGVALAMLRRQVQPLVQHLARSERRMAGILEEQSELVSLARPDGELVYVNPAYARHFGLTPAQMTGQNLFDHVAPADVAQVRQTVDTVLRSKQPLTQENRMATAGGSTRWVSWRNRVQHDEHGQPLLHSVGRDITERKAAEQALHASQAILERTGRLAAIGGWELDLATQALHWTDETRRIHEVPAHFQPTLASAIAFYGPGSRAQIEAAVGACTRDGTPWDLELQMTTATGRAIWIRAQGASEWEDGQMVRLVGAFQDITARKLLEQRLAESERFIRQVADQLPVRIAYVDAQARYQFVNQAHCQRFGLPREQIVGRRREELRPGPANALVDQARDQVLRGHAQRIEFDEEVDGRTVRIESRMLPDLGSAGEVRGFYSIGIDITERSAAERALRDLTTIFDNTTDYVVQADPRGQIVYMNPAVRQATGIAADAPLGARHFNDFNTPQTRARYADTIVPTVMAHGVWIGRTAVVVAGGRVVPVDHMVIAHRNADGRVERFSAIMRDISAEVAAQQAQQRQAAVLQSVAEAIPALVAVVDGSGHYRFANTAFERWLGLPREAIVGRPMAQVLGASEHARCQPWIARVLGGETVQFEQAYPERPASQHLAISYVPLRLTSGDMDGFVAVAQDITRHKLEEGRLIQLSQRDALTGLLNRSGFEQTLAALRQGADAVATTALMYIDLDHFKPVNDTHGHPVGDELLRQFAQRLVRSVRPSDAVARLGGDEFAIALPQMRDAASAQAVAGKIVAAARTPFVVNGLTLQVSASLGLALGTDASEDWAAVVARADAMLYRAKAAGRGRYAGGDAPG